MPKENKYFKIESVDDCIWLIDKRTTPLTEIHLTRNQAEELSEMLRLEERKG